MNIKNHLLFLCSILCATTTIQATSEGFAIAEEKNKQISLESNVVKEEFLKKDFYKKYKENLHLSPQVPLPEQQAHTTQAFLDYKYRVLQNLLWNSFIQIMGPILILAILMIGWFVYCRFAVDLNDDLKSVLEFLSGISSFYPVEVLFGGNTDLHKMRCALFHLGYIILSLVSLSLFWEPFGKIINVSSFPPHLKDISYIFFIILEILAVVTILFPWAILGTTILFYTGYHFSEKIWPYIKFRFLGDNFFIDEMEASEVLYIQNQYRLSLSLQTIIEKKLFEARKHPKKRIFIHSFVKNAVELPSEKELHARVNFDDKDIDLSGFEEYDTEVQEELIELFLRYREGVKLYYNYFVGPAGVGKTNALRLFGEKIGAQVAVVSFAGASAKDLLGTPPSGNSQGYIGHIAEAIRNASPYGKTPLILFIDELDKALEGPYAKEIEDLCLKLFERSNDSLDSPYFKGYKIPLPRVIVFAGNKTIKGPLQNRLKTTIFKEYTWEAKERIILMKLPQIFQNLHIDPFSLKQENYEAIHAIIGQIKKEAEANPEDPKYIGLREIERRVLKYLEKNEMEKKGFIKRFKKSTRTKFQKGSKPKTQQKNQA